MLSFIKKIILLISIPSISFACEDMCPNMLYDEIPILDQEYSNLLKTKNEEMFKENFGDLNTEAHRLIFVSTSMPLKTLIQYEIDAQKYGFHLIMQGLVNESYPETMAYLQEFIKKTAGGISIDPELFQKFNIQQVPVIVLGDEKTTDRMTGNITLEYALRSFAKNGDFLTQAREILERAR